MKAPLRQLILPIILLLTLRVAAQGDCPLPSAIPSLLPNPSLESFDPTQLGCLSQQPGGLPDATNQANCLTGWQRASLGTTDAWNAFTLPGAPPLFPASLPQPLPSGTGLAGFWVGIEDEFDRRNADGESARIYREYLAACLMDEQRLIAGQDYRMTFSLGFTSSVRNAEGVELSSPSPVTLAVYGIRECGQLYFGDNWDCPEDSNAEGWELITEVTVGGSPERWTEADLNFTAAADYAGIAIGGSCGADPGSNRDSYYNYYFIDEIRLNVPEVFEQPVAGPVSVSGQSICAEAITLTGTETPGATYQWFKNGNPLSGQTGRTLRLNTGPDIDGRYNLRVTTAAGCAETEDVVIQRPILFDQIADSVALCAGLDTVRLFPRGNTIANNYSWSDGSTENFLNITEPGQYSVTVSNSCEQRVENFVAVANGEPTYRVVADPPISCTGDTVNLRIASNWQFSFIDYQVDESALVRRGIDEVSLVVPLGTTDIEVFIGWACGFQIDTVQLGGQRIEFTAEVPVLTCDEPTGTIRLTLTDPDLAEFRWTGPSGQPIGDSTPQLEVSAPGTYAVEVLDGSSCPATDTFNVVFGGTFMSGLEISEAQCGADGAATISPGGGTAPYRADWFAAGGTEPISSSQNSISDIAAGTYEVLVTDASGCELRETFTITAADSLTLAAQVTFADCENPSGGQITASATGGTAPYTFSLGTEFQSDPLFRDLPSDSYTLTVTDANGCTTDPVPVSIDLPLPFTIDLPEEVSLLQGDSALLTLQVSGIDPASGTVAWSPAAGLSCADCLSPTVRTFQSTRYEVTYTSAEGCSKIASVRVVVDGRVRYYAPNAFSPNGDGNNDFFRVFPGPSVANVAELRIFDRWGELVWETTSPDQSGGWDGTFRGKVLPPAAFAYTGKLLLRDGTTRSFSGSVTLFR